ncbi:MAG: class I SAM-dependent methyltransferase [Planctomycetota bacterium]|nr:class I SAM-dependent methyltransferase [Planctomycetota bacterium]
MYGKKKIDDGRCIDWGKTSADYVAYRPGPPESYYARLVALGVGLEGQRILDLATGTGFLARNFARQGAQVSAIDISAEQIEAARGQADEEGLRIDFHVAPAERTPFADASFDAITANQAWLYFDKAEVIPEVVRLLAKEGQLVVSHFSWLPRLDPIARRSEALVLKHNPKWSAADWDGEIPPLPEWSMERFRLRAFFRYDAGIQFTRETWRGRLRACRGVGASLSPEEVARFDAEHAKLLERTADETFSVLYRVQAHLFDPRVS